MHQESLWLSESGLSSDFHQLETTIDVDVAIIGGGLSGITTAYLLTKANKRVAVLEKNKIGSGMTGYTTAFITMVLDEPLQALVDRFGEQNATEVWFSGKKAIDLIETIIQEENISCEFTRCPAYYYGHSKEETKFLEKEAQIAHKLGFDVTYTPKDNLSFPHYGVLRIPNQAKFHPTKYLLELAKKTAEKGAFIFENTQVQEYTGKDPIVVKTPKGKVRAQFTITATHNPFNSPMLIQPKLLPFQTYIIAADIPKNTLPEAIYWDTESPYHYFRIDKKETKDRIILGGEDHKTGHATNTTKAYKALEEYLQKLLLQSKYTITHQWNGQVINTIDGLPYIGHLPLNGNHLITTGFSGTGMTFTTVSAMVNTDLITGFTNDWIPLYDPKRFTGAGEFLKHNIGYVGELVKGRMEKREEIPLTDIPTGEGKVIEVQGEQKAVYKNEDGTLIKLSPVCTHLGCIVEWNTAAKTWDCPCHGSRFTKEGDVLQGPAQKPLKKIEE